MSEKCPTCGASEKQPVTRCERHHHSHTPSPCILCRDPWHGPKVTKFPFDPYDKSDKEKAEAVWKGLQWMGDL